MLRKIVVIMILKSDQISWILLHIFEIAYITILKWFQA